MSNYFSIVFFVLGSLFSIPGFTQSKVYLNQPREQGYVVLATGDTLPGFIYYERNKELYSQIRFQKTPVEPLVNYDPSMVAAYYLGDSKQLFISGDLLKRYKKGNPIGSESTFLKALVSGSANLYQYSASGKPTYYATNNQTAEFLDKGKEGSDKIDGKLYLANKKPYQKTLQKMFSDCLKDTLSLRYLDHELIGLVEKYNQCVNSKSVKYGSRKSKVLFGATAGYLFSNLTFSDKNTLIRPYGYSTLAPKGQYDLLLLLNEQPTSTSLYAGFSMTIAFGKNKHLSYNTQLNYMQRKWSSALFELDLKYLDIPLTLQYNINLKGKVQPTLGLGVDFALNLSAELESDDRIWQFYRESYKLGGGDSWPDVLPVTMPAIFENEFKPTMIIPIATVGFDLVNKNSIVAFHYKFGFPATITKSPLYKSSVSNQMVSITVSRLW